MKCENFKVRINGAAALAIPAQRSHYGRFYLSVWSALSVALYQANNLTDFNEYNHRDNLLDQVCIFFFFIRVKKCFAFEKCFASKKCFAPKKCFASEKCVCFFLNSSVSQFRI